ncbi:MAG TPA: TM2 domain-containing protein [Candidatus Nanoarchaeia archaeon]|nr:TM2 domain-containing protein [Candidatus Nanoarchaeia archaeon]
MAEKKEKDESKDTSKDTNVNININTGSGSAPKKVNWVLTLIMSVVFGTLGVDRFIMGHVGLGILKLITLGGCGIWWLIDVILIATKHQFQGIEWVNGS